MELSCGNTNKGSLRKTSMVRYFLTYIILYFCLISVVAHAEETEYEKIQREASEKHMNRIKEEIERMDVEIRFYGKVLDQYNNPIESVDIFLHLTRFSPVMEKLFGETKNMQAKSDIQGYFSVIGEKGRSIYIDQIKKEGYEFSPTQNPVSGYHYSGEKNPFIPDQANPVVFHLRKKGETTFIIKEKYFELCLDDEKSGMTEGTDFIRRKKIDDLSKPIFNGEKLICDLKMKVTYNATNAAWTAMLMSGDPSGGIIASDQLLYEAPQEGYQSEFTFTAEDRKPPEKKFIYIKSRDPAIYTRIDIDDVAANKEYFCLHGQSYTNPYGDRNLEQVTDLPYAVDKQLSDEIRSAYKQNKRPPKPDLQKLINVAKGNSAQ
jgi:hypothetical protein